MTIIKQSLAMTIHFYRPGPYHWNQITAFLGYLCAAFQVPEIENANSTILHIILHSTTKNWSDIQVLIKLEAFIT